MYVGVLGGGRLESPGKEILSTMKERKSEIIRIVLLEIKLGDRAKPNGLIGISVVRDIKT